MSSDDALREEILRLKAEGLSIRQIAKRLGLSRMMVQRTIAAAIEPADDDEDDDELMERLTATDVPVRPC